MKERIILPLAFLLILIVAGCAPRTSPVATDKHMSSPAAQIFFVVPAELPEAKKGAPYHYSFCQPGPVGTASCDSSSQNPRNGAPPYHFQLDSGSGFPPLGLTLGLNGILQGTPVAAGRKEFTVCAVDLSGTQSCQKTALQVAQEEIPAGITLLPQRLTVRAPRCEERGGCKVAGTVKVVSGAPWSVLDLTCSPGIFGMYSACPASGGPGEQEVEISSVIPGRTPGDAEEYTVERPVTFGSADGTIFVQLHLTLVIP